MKRFSKALDYAVAFGIFIFFFDTDAMAQTLDWFALGWFLSPQANDFL
jgi:hypothetical protein